MFAYIDPSIKRELQEDGKLFFLDEQGRALAAVKKGAAPFLSVVGPIPLPIRVGAKERTFQWYAWVRNADLTRIEAVVAEVRQSGPRGIYSLLSEFMAVSSILVYGDFAAAAAPLVRVHSNCLTGDVFGSLRCDCGPQLAAALEAIVKARRGALIYMAGHEGRGIGLWAKAITYLLQDAGHDTYEANVRLGLPVDSRDFSDAARLINYFRGSGASVRLLGNNPLKRRALEEMGVEVAKQVPLVVGVSRHNARYLKAKRRHGHLIAVAALSGAARGRKSATRR
ncbi:MAG: GTP cyclohydrolase II [Deltaproteobacteria bacterium]|nr:GTP cyclohydrolase II [Deltaproteobacteria bacterium]